MQSCDQRPTEYWNKAQSSKYLGISKGTLSNWVSRAKYEADPIPFTKFSTRCLRFLNVDLIEWASRRDSNRKLKRLSEGPPL
jgi:hypothetical protein